MPALTRPVNKVVYGDRTLIDLTEDTVTSASLAKGITAHDASGKVIIGEAELLDKLSDYERILFFGDLSAVPTKNGVGPSGTIMCKNGYDTLTQTVNSDGNILNRYSLNTTISNNGKSIYRKLQKLRGMQVQANIGEIYIDYGNMGMEPYGDIDAMCTHSNYQIIIYGENGNVIKTSFLRKMYEYINPYSQAIKILCTNVLYSNYSHITENPTLQSIL